MIVCFQKSKKFAFSQSICDLNQMCVVLGNFSQSLSFCVCFIFCQVSRFILVSPKYHLLQSWHGINNAFLKHYVHGVFDGSEGA